MTTLDALRDQLNRLIETAAADINEIQQQQSLNASRLAEHAAAQAFRAGEQNGRTIEQTRCLAILDQHLASLTPASGSHLALSLCRQAILCPNG